MGYDTTAYRGRIVPTSPRIVPSMAERGDEVAELRGNWGLFEALDAQKYDGQVSGIGIGRWLTRAQIRTGLDRLRIKEQSLDSTEHTYRPGIEFLESCLSSLPMTEEWLYIEFA